MRGVCGPEIRLPCARALAVVHCVDPTRRSSQTLAAQVNLGDLQLGIIKGVSSLLSSHNKRKQLQDRREGIGKGLNAVWISHGRQRQCVFTGHHIRDRITLVQDNPAISFDTDSLNSSVLKLNNLWAAAQKKGWWGIDCILVSERESERAQSIYNAWLPPWKEWDPENLGNLCFNQRR